MTTATVSVSAGAVAELNAHKEAIRIDPPYTTASKSKNSMGTLVVGTTFSNFNVVRHMFSDDEAPFETGDDGAPQLLSQIVMCDSKAKPNSPPMIRFSAPASDMLAILKHPDFLQLVRSHCDVTPTPLTSGKTRGEVDEVDDVDAGVAPTKRARRLEDSSSSAEDSD
jgi:hypothetical protein